MLFGKEHKHVNSIITHKISYFLRNGPINADLACFKAEHLLLKTYHLLFIAYYLTLISYHLLQSITNLTMTAYLPPLTIYYLQFM